MPKKDTEKTWISPETAVENAINSIKIEEIQRPPDSAPKITGGTPSTPFFIKRIDKEDSAYFLVPWMYKNRVKFIVQINARNGEFEGISIFEKAIRPPIISSDSALRCAKKAYPRMDFINKGLVWKPCKESTDPSSPFYLLESGDFKIFVDMECNTLASLKPLGKGG